jgi:cytochrome bd-type quinol oxidase subunit 2
MKNHMRKRGMMLKHDFKGVGVIVLPLISAYTIGVYWVFRGKG